MATPAYSWLFAGKLDETSQTRTGLAANTLVLPDKEFVAHDSLDKPSRVSLRGRDLRGVVLKRADLRKADLTGADLRGADLSSVRLEDAILDSAKLQNAVLEDAHLEGASLAGAHFEVANLQIAHFAGTKALDKYDGPHFEGADLTNADFRAADLFLPQFQAAVLNDTDFRAARLDNATFWGSTFVRTKLDAAHLKPIVLWHTMPVNLSTCFVLSEQPFVYYDPVVFRRTGGSPLFLINQEVRDKYLSDTIEALSFELDTIGKEKLTNTLGALLSKISPWTSDDQKESMSTWKSKNHESCEGTLPEKFIDIACSATANVYVSKGLIYNGALDDLQPKELGEVTQAMLDPEVCPGATELTDRDKAELRKLALSH